MNETFKKLDGCARCGETHKDITFTPLTRPIVDNDGQTWTHWAPCPTNGEPILCGFASEPT